MNKHRIPGRGGANRRPHNEQNGTQGGLDPTPDKTDGPGKPTAAEKGKKTAKAHAKAKAKYQAGMALWPAEVAALLGYSRATVSGWCNRTHHRLPKVGGKILPSHLDQWLEQEAARQSGGGGGDDAQ